MKTFPFTNRWGSTYLLCFSRANYAQNGNLAIEVECEEGPYATLTVNLGDVQPGNRAYVDTNNTPDLYDFVVESGWGKKVGEAQSGFCTYPLVEFTDEFLDEVCVHYA